MLTINRLLALLFLGSLVIPALPLGGYAGGGQQALVENRRLAPAPDFSGAWSGLPAQVTDWLADHFPGRATLIAAANRTRFTLGMEPNHRAVIGDEGWLFLTRKNLLNQARGADPLSEPETSRLVSHFRGMQDDWAARGVTWMHLLVPGKSSAVSQRLPRRVRPVGPSRAQQYQQALAAGGLQDLDLWSALGAGTVEVESLYYRTDSHWNCLAAGRAYEALMQALPQYTRLPAQALQVDETPYSGDIARGLFGLGQAPREVAPRCALPPVELRAEDHDAPERPVAYPPRHQFDQLRTVRVRNTDALNDARVAVVRDSFFWELAPFVDRTFSDVLYVYHWGLSDHRDLLAAFDPELVIYQYTDRALHDQVEQWRATPAN